MLKEQAHIFSLTCAGDFKGFPYDAIPYITGGSYGFPLINQELELESGPES
jgi:hypothetical protein